MEIQVGSVNVILEMELPIILGSILGFAAIVSAVGIGYFLFKKWKRNQARYFFQQLLDEENGEGDEHVELNLINDEELVGFDPSPSPPNDAPTPENIANRARLQTYLKRTLYKIQSSEGKMPTQQTYNILNSN